MGRRAVEEITDKQKEILELIIKMTAENGYQPSRAELAVVTGTTRHAVSQKVKHLVSKGFLEQPEDGGGERCLRIRGVAFKASMTEDFVGPGVRDALEDVFSSEEMSWKS
jgi:SOS-response transcriptional repressor LexA